MNLVPEKNHITSRPRGETTGTEVGVGLLLRPIGYDPVAAKDGPKPIENNMPNYGATSDARTDVSRCLAGEMPATRALVVGRARS
jgi:hypothetical protein